MKPKLTILLPTTRTEFFMDCLDSILNQSYKDFIVIVSDNTSDGKVIGRFGHATKDHRVQWFHAYHETNGDPLEHLKFLTNKVETDYFKFMFDDDLLACNSLSHLVLLMELGCDLGFHARYMIDEKNNLNYISKALKEGAIHKFNFNEIAKVIATTNQNIFGEPSFHMYKNNVKIEFEDLTLAGLPVRYLVDVVVPLKVAKKGTICGSGYSLGFFRKHSMQDSSMNSPVRLAGLVEWELICRYLNTEVNFDAQTVELLIGNIKNIYKSNGIKFPILNAALTRIENDQLYKLSTDFAKFYWETRKLQGLSSYC